ncbi:Uncharacterised protein [uncultured Bacteroides sp.]|nr:Uncharacterised protein [uncultured Bacteroides sp.]
MIDHNHFICHFIFGGHLLNIPNLRWPFLCLQKKIGQVQTSLSQDLPVSLIFRIFRESSNISQR